MLADPSSGGDGVKVCTIDGCNRPHCARGWCNAHWQRWRRTGDPLGTRQRAPRRDTAQHGSRRRYQTGCRCDLCWRAQKRYRIARDRVGSLRVDAAPIVAHVDALIASGWTRVDITREAGLGNSTLWHMTRSTTGRINRRTADAILTLEPYAPITLPAGPLLALLDARRVQLRKADRTDYAAVRRARRTGTISEAIADRIAVRHLGLTSIEVYGHDHDQAVSA